MLEATKAAITADIQSNAIQVYIKGTPAAPQCGFSKAVCDVLVALNAPFSATNVLENLDVYRAALGEISQWPTIPQIFINGEFVGGCDIFIEMYHSGELQTMLSQPASAVLDGTD